MNRHGVKTEKKHIFFMSFKGNDKESSLDQVTVPPVVECRGMVYPFGEWLLRGTHTPGGRAYDWQSTAAEDICQLATEYWNQHLERGDLPRRFDRMANKQEIPPESR